MYDKIIIINNLKKKRKLFKPPRVQFAHGEAPSHLTFLLRQVSQAVVIFTRLFS
jgi:hypothetical protein